MIETVFRMGLQYGLPTVLVLIFIYLQIRENKGLVMRLNKVEDEYRKILVTIVKENTEANQKLCTLLESRTCPYGNKT